MRDLAACPRCRRLHRLGDTRCPFCFFARVVTFAAVLPLAIACHSEAKKDPVPAASTSEVSAVVVTPSASVAASVVASAEPTAVASLTPSAIASVKQGLVGRDAGGLVALGGPIVPAYGNPGLAAIGAYGGAPSPGPKGDVSTTIANAQSGDERTIAGRRAMFRMCYQKGLAEDPTMAGKVDLSVSVDADGNAHATVKSGSGLSEPTKQCMAASVARATFEAGAAHTFDVTVTATPLK